MSLVAEAGGQRADPFAVAAEHYIDFDIGAGEAHVHPQCSLEAEIEIAGGHNSDIAEHVVVVVVVVHDTAHVQ